MNTLSKLSIMLFFVNFLVLILALQGFFSGYIVIGTAILGFVLAIIGVFKKGNKSNFGLWGNALFLFVFLFWIYVPPMIFGE
ncbi:hypothetical protein P4V41_20665 [Fictibacillus nanhaiensis]|uniref:hypothetical protein n=1 Tax=Fictibacillus nanhaiensis TaxID=742169 RepID=UPI002E1B5D7E|nr:hypothetical protein [Fictibacillus nanhaiensis]